MSEKVHSKRPVKEYDDEPQCALDQSLYSRAILLAEKVDLHFFGIPLGIWNDTLKKEQTGTDTNMWCSSQLVNGQEFLIHGIRFKETDVSVARRAHLMQHAYFMIRIADRDFLIYPYHLMENYFFFVERRLSIPLFLPQHYNFHVILRLDKPYHRDIELTCELIGELRRPQ